MTIIMYSASLHGLKQTYSIHPVILPPPIPLFEFKRLTGPTLKCPLGPVIKSFETISPKTWKQRGV